MERLELLQEEFSVCRLAEGAAPDLSGAFCFAARTDEELSLVCPTGRAPADALAQKDGWRCFRVAGTLDFSLVGVLAGLCGVLAEAGVPVFAFSTYNTDYVLLPGIHLKKATAALQEAGYGVRAEKGR